VDKQIGYFKIKPKHFAMQTQHKLTQLITNPTPEYDSDGSGKMEMPLPQTLETATIQTDKTASTILAQSIKAQRQQTAYDRTPNYKTQEIGNNNAPQPALHIMPNPAQNSTLIAWDNTCNGILMLYDYTGRVILEKPVSGKNSNIDLSTLPNGTFIVRLISNGETIANGKIAVLK
jgi:hypothetical protein